MTNKEQATPEPSAEELSRQAADDWVNKGVDLWSLGRNEAALECYDRALGLAPGHALAWMNRGNILADQGEHEAAVADYDKALAIDSSLCRAWFNKGDELGHLRRFIEAKACFENARDLGQEQGDSEVVTQARIMVGRCDDVLMNEEYG